MLQVDANSFTRSVREWLEDSRQPRILHVFDQVCNLVNERREILSVVTPEIGNGPFNLVIQESVLFVNYLDAESKVSIDGKQILLGDIAILFTSAQMWNPAPRWDDLRKSKDALTARLGLLPIAYENEAILQFSAVLSLAIINADVSAAKNIASKLAGLGIGLTPAGDDFLMGAMYAAQIIHPQEIAKTITEEIVQIAAPLTTSLSGAWLRSAAKGEAGEIWHDFFDALIEDKNIYIPMSKILSIGATSGSDALAGFLVCLLKWGI